MITHDVAQQIVNVIDDDARVIAVKRLSGGVSAFVYRIDTISEYSGEASYTLRYYEDENKAERLHREWRLLSALSDRKLPVPQHRFFAGLENEFMKHSFTLSEYIVGATIFSPEDNVTHLQKCAAMLARIHRAGVKQDLPYQHKIVKHMLRNPPLKMDASSREAEIRELLRANFAFSRRNLDDAVLLHGDYWLGNILWNDGEIAGVIDWEDAAIGDPLSDLANSRLEMCFAFGKEGMQHFTDAYLQQMPQLDISDLPLWDLFAALRPMGQLAGWAAGWGDYGRADVTFETMTAAHQDFIAAAFAQL